MKRRRYIQLALALLVTLIVGGTMLVNSPRVQQRVSVLLATELENYIGTRVNLGGVRWLFPNDIVIDSLSIDDQEGELLLSVDRLAAKVEWMPLIRHRQLSIRNIRLFHPDIHLYKADSVSDYNFQFLIDAFAIKQEKKKEPSRLSLRINTLLIRNAHICHQVASEATKSAKGFNPNNLSIDNFSAQLSLKMLSTDSISMSVRHLELKEHSGLNIDDLYFRLVANRHGATLANFQFDMPHSTLRFDTVWASFPVSKLHPTKADLLKSLIVKGKLLPTSHITPADLAALLPQASGITEQIYIGTDFIGSPSRVNLKGLDIHTSRRDIVLRANAKWQKDYTEKSDLLTVKLSEASITDKTWPLLAEQAPNLYTFIPKEVTRIGNIKATGNAEVNKKKSILDLKVLTDAGDIGVHLQIDEQRDYHTTFHGDRLQVAKVVPQSPLTHTSIELEAKGHINHPQASNSTKRPMQKPAIEFLKSLEGTFTAKASHTGMLGYEYKELVLNGNHSPKNYGGTITLNDPNGNLSLKAQYLASEETPHYTISMDADSLNLHRMQLIDVHEGKSFSAQLNGDISGADFNHMIGEISLDSLMMHREGDDYVINRLSIHSTDAEKKMLSINSDFMSGSVSGEFKYQTLANSLLCHLHRHIPTLCPCQNNTSTTSDNICYATLNIYDATPLHELLLIPIDLYGTAQCEVLLNDFTKTLKASASIPDVNYNDNNIKGISLDCHTEDHAIELYAGATLHNEDEPALTASLITKAVNDSINLGVIWSSNPKGKFEGTFHSQATLSMDSQDRLTVAIKADSTSAILNHSEWRLTPFSVEIAPEHIRIDDMHLTNGSTQHLSADGVIAECGTDTLQVSFTGIDLGYMLSLVKLEGVSFDAKVSGRADIANLYSDKPYVQADISAKDFIFCEGPMGDVNGEIHWDQTESQLKFLADVWETPQHISKVDGYVDFKKDELWIDIAADSTNVSFLNSMLKSFMNDIKGHAYGHLTVGGPLKAINLDGALLANAEFNLTPTNTRYHFHDSLHFKPDTILFNGIEAFDHREQKGIINGIVTHNALKDYVADLYIDAQNILGIDLPDTGHDSFYTTIFGTGTVHVTSPLNKPLVIDVQAQSEKGSVFALNLDPQDVSSNEKFITFTSRSDTRNTPTITTRTSKRKRRRRPVESDIPTHINIAAQVTPDATLKLVMNQAVDDHISISGYGDLQVSIQGSDINLFGTYTADRGFYRLSLQDVINKNFDVIPGSTVSFEGDYMNTRLNITARHTVNYVPLRDLNPEMTGYAHVNCLLHIGGTLNSPSLTFDLELPKGTEEEKAILRSYTNTEEQMNQQFIYLLGLGKFYTPDMRQNNQAAGNVESFISSTISGQINNLLAGIISNDNWNFASNLRAENLMTGESDLDGENWDNMEIEGILEGRLLDNRLLINGSFGYRDNPMYATNFIGDFDIRYLLNNSFSLKGYNKTNDRYFSRTSLTTQGVGIVFERDFESLLPQRKKDKSSSPTAKKKQKKK